MVIEQQNRHSAARIGEPAGAPVSLSFEGQTVVAYESDTIATALLAAGVRVFTMTEIAGDRRGGFCFVGRCADCLVVVDGQANQRACLTPVRAGMDVRMQRGHGAVEPEVGP
ncbi:MAG: (2Fe-2S)-binding protein [Thermomicrobiales bacterium]|nr:(2Fe-2S)-binding protein [Thermomicrobiales bacterium]